jgi:hypothetical protein
VVKTKPLSDKEIRNIIERFGKIHDLPIQFAVIAIYILILKGAANTGTPLTFEIEFLNEEGEKILT